MLNSHEQSKETHNLSHKLLLLILILLTTSSFSFSSLVSFVFLCCSLVSFSFCLCVCIFFKQKAYILMHIQLCKWVSEKGFLRKQATFCWTEMLFLYMLAKFALSDFKRFCKQHCVAFLHAKLPCSIVTGLQSY